MVEVSDADAGMDELLLRRPDAMVVAVDDGGLFIPVPPSVPLGSHPSSTARSALDLVQPTDRKAVIAAWEQNRLTGRSSVSVTLVGPDLPLADLHFFDARAVHGVYLGVIVCTGESSDGLVAATEVTAPQPRLARVRKDETARLLHADGSVEAMLGWAPDELIGQRSLDFVHPDDHDTAIDAWMDCLSHPGFVRRTRLRHQHRDGRWLWLELANRNLLDEQGYVDCEMFDISDEMEALDALRTSEQMFRRLAGALPVGVVHFDVHRHMSYANDQLFDIFGAPADIEMAVLRSCVVDLQELDAAIGRVYRGDDIDLEVQIDRADGRGRRRCTFALRPLTSVTGEVIGSVGCLVDVTDSTRMRSELERRATYDALTGCVNRATALSTLATLLNGLPASDTGVAVVFVDLDDFKSVNDRFGHAAGDDFLAAIADRLRTAVRDVDVVGRLGGDEFLLVCPDAAGPEIGQMLGDRVTATLATPLSIGRTTLIPRASIGVAWTDRHRPIDADRLVAEADAAMYRAKAAVHGRPAVSTPR